MSRGNRLFVCPFCHISLSILNHPRWFNSTFNSDFLQEHLTCNLIKKIWKMTWGWINIGSFYFWKNQSFNPSPIQSNPIFAKYIFLLPLIYYLKKIIIKWNNIVTDCMNATKICSVSILRIIIKKKNALSKVKQIY